MKVSKRSIHGRDPSERELKEAKRIASLHPDVQKTHPTARKADQTKMGHINTYGFLPEYYIDRPFVCQDCGKEEIWRAKDQKWYIEEAKGHMDAKAIRCHDCRMKLKEKKTQPVGGHNSGGCAPSA